MPSPVLRRTLTRPTKWSGPRTASSLAAFDRPSCPPTSIESGQRSKRRKRLLKEADKPPSPPPSLTGIAQLLSEMQVATLDLHGYTADQARPRLRDFLTTHSRISSESVVHIITGKGTGSAGDAVLLELVREMLDDEAAHHVDEYAGMLGGGGWVVRVK